MGYLKLGICIRSIKDVYVITFHLIQQVHVIICVTMIWLIFAYRRVSDVKVFLYVHMEMTKRIAVS